MIEFAPFMLILLWWHPDEPGQFRIERFDRLYAAEADCRSAGKAEEARVDSQERKHLGGKLTSFCLPMPSNSEVQEAFNIMTRRNAENGE